MSEKSKRVYEVMMNLGEKISGVEKASMERHSLIKTFSDSKMVTIIFNRTLKENFKRYDISSTEYINLFDFFQEAVFYPYEKKVLLNDIFPNHSYQIKQVRNLQDYRIYENGIYVAYVHLYENESISYVNYFDSNKKKTERHLYDSRGFLSVRQVLNDKNIPIAEFYYSPNGQIKLEKYIESMERQYYQVYFENRKFFVPSNDDLQRLFFKFLLKPNDTVLLDSTRRSFYPIIESDFRGDLIPIFHAKHFIGKNSQTDRIGPRCEYVLNNLDKVDKIVTLTHRQRDDIAKRFDNKKQLEIVAPSTSIECKPNNLTINENETIHIGIVARYSVEKQLEHAIKAFDLVHKQNENTMLHMHCYTSNTRNLKIKSELIQLVSDLGIEKAVIFYDFVVDMSEVYNKLHMLMLTSIYEAFPMVLLEGMSYGIPFVAYNIQYGPDEAIEEGVSGYLVKPNQYEEIAQRINYLIENPEIYKRMAEKAYRRGNDFSKEKITNLWRKILKE